MFTLITGGGGPVGAPGRSLQHPLRVPAGALLPLPPRPSTASGSSRCGVSNLEGARLKSVSRLSLESFSTHEKQVQTCVNQLEEAPDPERTGFPFKGDRKAGDFPRWRGRFRSGLGICIIKQLPAREMESKGHNSVYPYVRDLHQVA